METRYDGKVDTPKLGLVPWNIDMIDSGAKTSGRRRMSSEPHGARRSARLPRRAELSKAGGSFPSYPRVQSPESTPALLW